MQAAYEAIKPVDEAAVYLNLFMESSLMDYDHSPRVSLRTGHPKFTDSHTDNHIKYINATLPDTIIKQELTNFVQTASGN